MCGMGVCVYVGVCVYGGATASIAMVPYLAQNASFIGPFFPRTGKMKELYAIGSFPFPPTYRVKVVAASLGNVFGVYIWGWAGEWGGVQA